MLMSGSPAAQAGMKHKAVPASFGPAGELFSGGRYLFETRLQAARYAKFVTRDFHTGDPPVQFLDRPEFVTPQCFDWRVIGARELGLGWREGVGAVTRSRSPSLVCM